jgi:hypothetical protein
MVPERVGPRLPFEIGVSELVLEVFRGEAGEELLLPLLHLRELGGERVQRGQVLGESARRSSPPALEPEPFGAHDVKEGSLERAEARGEVLLQVLGRNGGRCLENPRVGPAVVAVEELDLVPIHAADLLSARLARARERPRYARARFIARSPESPRPRPRRRRRAARSREAPSEAREDPSWKRMERRRWATPR